MYDIPQLLKDLPAYSRCSNIDKIIKDAKKLTECYKDLKSSIYGNLTKPKEEQLL